MSRGALAYLEKRALFGVKLGLASMRALCAALGNPERAAPALLIAGTNGKGSVVALLDAALRAGGRRVGRYTSPHLLRVHERIALDGRPIGDADLEACVGEVRDAAEGLVRAGTLEDHPTHFEALTAAAFVHFRDQGADVAVLEVGMGGRLDATNACEPLVSAIVSIALDHTAHLGGDLAAVAREKAGVMRKERPTVVGPLPEPALEVVRARADAIGGRLVEAAAGVSVQERDERLDVHTPERHLHGIRPLAGRHQRDNLLVAVRCLEEAAREGLELDFAQVPEGLSAVDWPGRLQLLPGRPALLLDGAHNAAGAKALADHVRGERFVLLFAAMADKDVEGMAAVLFPLAQAVVVCRAGGERGAPPEEIARRAAGAGSGVELAASVAEGLERARRRAGPEGMVLVAGSLYLVGAVLGLLEAEAEAPAG